MSDIFNEQEFLAQDMFDRYRMRPEVDYEPDAAYELATVMQGKEPEVEFRQTPDYDQQLENFERSMPKTLYAMLKGLVQGELGLGGDIEQLFKSAKVAGQSYFGDEKTAEEYDQMLQDLENTSMPTTKQVKEKFDQYFPASEGFEASERIGEYLGPGATILGAAKLLKSLFKKEKGALAAGSISTKGVENDD